MISSDSPTPNFCRLPCHSLVESPSRTSTSSQLSFHSFTDSVTGEVTVDHPNERTDYTSCRKSRKDSGYAEEPRKSVYRISSDNGAFNFLKMQNSDAPRSIRQEKGHDSGSRTCRRGVSSQPCSRSSQIGQPLKGSESVLHLTKPSSTNLSGSSSRRLASPPASARQRHVSKPAALRRAATIHPMSKAGDVIATHRRAKEIISALEGSKAYPLATATNTLPSGYYGYSFAESRTSLSPRDSVVPSLSSATKLASFQSPNSPQSSTFSPATTIDWTHPATRRRTYEKHDRKKTGIRGAVRRITPRWLRGDDGIDFYDGDGDAGSVRRYRLDLDPGEETPSKQEEAEKSDEEAGRREAGPGHRKNQHTDSGWSCLGRHSRREAQSGSKR